MRVLVYDFEAVEGHTAESLAQFCEKPEAEVIAALGQPDQYVSLLGLQENLNWGEIDTDAWYVFVT